MILISLTSILVVAFVLFAVASICVLIFKVITGLVGGASIGVDGIKDRAERSRIQRQQKEFYDDCVIKNVGHPDKCNPEKVKLIGELHNIWSDSMKIYEGLYRENHKDEFPEYFAEQKGIRNQKLKRKIAIFLIASILLVLCFVVIFLLATAILNGKGYRNFNVLEVLNMSGPTSVVMWVCGIFLWLIMLIPSYKICDKYEESQEKKKTMKRNEEITQRYQEQREKEIQEKLKNM